MTLPTTLVQTLQAQLAPVLHEVAAVFVDALERRAGLDELAAQPNLDLLLRAMESRQIAGGGKLLDFGGGNQFGDVSIGDVSMGSMTKLTLNVQLHQHGPQVPLISDVTRLAPEGGGGLAAGNTNAALPPGPPPVRPCRVLVLDGRTKGDVAATLRRELRLRGIESPEPRHLDAPMAQALRADLEGADAAVVALSPESCAGTSALREHELPELWGRYGRAAPFAIVPLLDGVTPEFASATLTLPGTRLGEFRALDLPADPAAQPGALAALAGIVLREVAGPRLRAAGGARALALTIFSYPPIGATPSADLALNWEPLFPEPEHPTRPPPSQESWRTALDPALADVRYIVGAAQAGDMAISGRYHLSAGLALGFRFRNTVTMPLSIAAQPGDLWRTDVAGNDGEYLQASRLPHVLEGPDLSVEVSLSRDVRDDAEHYLREHRIPARQRVQLTSSPLLAQEPDIKAAQRFVSSPAHAQRLAEQVANVILAHTRGHVHLFAAIPQALAVLIGAQLNKTRPVQCYELFEHPEKGRIYVLSCTLR